MPLHSQLGRAVAAAMRTARRTSTPKNTQSDDGVVYSRPSTEQEVAIADVGLGRTTREDENDDDLVIRDDSVVDFLIAVDELVFDGARVEPAEGDRLTWYIQNDDGDPHADEGTAQRVKLVYEVARTPAGETAWRYTDPARTTFRIHAKLVEETKTSIEWEA